MGRTRTQRPQVRKLCQYLQYAGTFHSQAAQLLKSVFMVQVFLQWNHHLRQDFSTAPRSLPLNTSI